MENSKILGDKHTSKQLGQKRNLKIIKKSQGY